MKNWDTDKIIGAGLIIAVFNSEIRSTESPGKIHIPMLAETVYVKY